MPPSPTVDSTRLEYTLESGFILTPLSIEHVTPLFSAFSTDESSVHVAMPWLDSSLPMKSQIASFVVDVISGPNSSSYHHWVLVNPDNNSVLGIIGFDVVRFRTIERRQLSRGIHWNLGYWIAPSHRRRGLASESIDIMIRVAKESEVDVVQLSANPENIGGIITIRSAVERHGGIVSGFGVEMIEESEGEVYPYEAYWILSGDKNG